MNQVNSELAQAESEVNFWRDFIYWWEAKHGQPIEPRSLEALAAAEKRYRAAIKLLGAVNRKTGKPGIEQTWRD